MIPAQPLPSLPENGSPNGAPRRLEVEVGRLNRALRTLSECNKALVHAREETALLQSVCDILVEVGGYTMAWIGFAEDDEKKSIRPVAHAGHEDGYLDQLNLSWEDAPEGRGPAGVAIRTGQPSRVFCVEKDPVLEPWREAALARGYRYILALPLICSGKTLGALTIYTAEQHALESDEEISLLKELANDLAFGIGALRTQAEREQTRRALAASEERYRLLFDQMLDGFALHEILLDADGKPCDYRFLEVNPAFERLTTLKAEDIIGRTAREVLPGLEPYWVETYGEVALTGKAISFENYVKDLDSYYEISAFSPQPGQFATVFMDITARKRAERVQNAIYKISQAAVSVESLDELYASIHKILGEIMPVENFYIALYDPQADLISFPYFVDQYDPPGPPVKPRRGLTEYVLRLGKTVLVPQEKFQELVDRGEVELVGTDSVDWLGAPLQAGGRVFGVLVTQSYTPGVRLDQKDAELWEFVSNQVAQAVHRRQVEDEIRRNAARAETLARFAAQLNANLDLNATLAIICREAAGALNAPAASVMLYDPVSEVYRHTAAYGLPSDFGQRASPTPRGLYDEAVKKCGAMVIAQDIQAVPGLPNAAVHKDYDIRTVISAGMIYGNTPVGGLNVMTFGTQREFTSDEMDLLRGLADQASLAIINARQYEEAQRRLQNVNSLREIDMAITGSLDLRLTLKILLSQVAAQLGVDAASVLIFDPFLNSLEYAAGIGFRTDALQHTRLRLGEGYAGLAALEQRVIHIPDLDKALDGLERSQSLGLEGFVTYFAVPFISKGQVKGVLEVFHRSRLEIDQEWRDFLDALCNQAAIAVDNIQLFNDLQTRNRELNVAYDATLEGWSHALDLRDQETEGHSRRVADLTIRLARELNVPSAQLIHIRRGALLHDIGKIGIPDRILHKPGPLTEEEWEVMRMHPVYAHQLLSTIDYLRPALDIPYYHHEKWDGSGYPTKMKGTQIPVAARIFAVADVWDALTSDRPYRPAWSEPEALEYIRSQAGAHFDPQVVQAFLRIRTGRNW